MTDGFTVENRRGLLLVGAVLVGLAVSAVHWIGLAVGGALVGLVAQSTRHGLVAGAGFGLIAWLIFVVEQFQNGAWPPGDAITLFGLALGIAVGLGVVGASVRALR
jgi:NO-binding membrane sensor protein with MHYT domain